MNATARLSSNPVAVIGAGINGILATRYLLDAGLDVTVVERNNKTGAVWSVVSAESDFSGRPTDVAKAL